MKTKIRFVNFKNSSPILVLSSKSLKRVDDLIKGFKFNSSNPCKVMIDFIAYCAQNNDKVICEEIYEKSGFGPSELENIKNISVREPRIVEFVYKKENGETDWRKVDIVEENSQYIKGNDINDDNKFKSFKKNCIVGNRVIKQ